MPLSNRMIIFLPEQEPRVYNLDAFRRNKILLGRGGVHGSQPSDPENDIVIPGGDREKGLDYSFVGRAQCTLYCDHGRWFIHDDHSTNGMRYQDQRIETHELHDGDMIYIGESVQRRMALMFSSREVADTSNMRNFNLRGRKRFVIGRAPDCDIVLNYPTVSREHCIITEENGAYFITDNGSKNGVVLNGSLLRRKERLGQMDKITIADKTMFFNDGQLFLNEPRGGVSISTRNLFRKVGKGASEKYITNDVTLSIRPNEFVAIVGGSGAGKTTLLNCLSGMTGFTSGEIFINGESIATAGKSLRSLMGYVPQQDIVYDTLTLERMLFYSAQLRMPSDTSREEIMEKIDETLKIVELSEHRQTMISKLSGGQRKRASIAVELLASPKLFFLDEPSSGLDPGTEKHLMQMLRRLSESGKTVIMVTHTVQNIDLCDRLVCMGKGGLLCYSGPPGEAATFFGKPRITDIYDDLNENSLATARRFRQSTEYRSQAQDRATAPAEVDNKNHGFGALLRQFLVMTQRYAEIMKNSVSRLLLLLLMPLILTVLVCLAFQVDGGIYNALKIDIERLVFPFLGARDTMSVISAFSCAAFWVGIFNSVQELSKERAIFEREKFTGVAVFPYLMSKFAILTLLCIVQAAIMTELLWLLSNTVCTVDPGKDLATDLTIEIGTDGAVFTGGSFWLELFLTTFLCVISAMCLGLTISSAVSNDMALVLCPICLLPQLLFSGVAAPLTGITKAISWVICCRWSCIAILTSVHFNDMYEAYTFMDGFVPIGPQGLLADEAYDAETSFLFGQNPVASAWIAFLIISVVCMALAYLVLRFLKREHR